ncbi:MAG: hypothetical protein ACI4EG_10370 [Fusicatenibacter sp.]|nr:hypothetical protein [Fusicatenibacter sp.]
MSEFTKSCFTGSGVPKYLPWETDPFASHNISQKVGSVLLDCINMRSVKNLSKMQKYDLMTKVCSFVNLNFAELTNKYPFEAFDGQMR